MQQAFASNPSNFGRSIFDFSRNDIRSNAGIRQRGPATPCELQRGFFCGPFPAALPRLHDSHRRKSPFCLRPGAFSIEAQPGDDRLQIFPVPLILDNAEYEEVIAPGVRQRARALRRLFQLIVEMGAPQGVPGLGRDLVAEVFRAERIDERQFREVAPGATSDGVAMVYAPDLVRAPTGNWVVIEDNVGCVGGTCDACGVLARYLALTGHQVVESPQCHRRFRAKHPLVTRAHPASTRRSGRNRHSWPHSRCLPSGLTDRENERRRSVLESIRMNVYEYNGAVPLAGDRARDNQTKAVLNFHPNSQPLHSETLRSWNCERNPFVLNSAFVQILGNKCLLPFIDEFIATHLGQAPILKTQPTQLLANVQFPLGDVVLKSSAGCQGRDIFFWNTMTGAERDGFLRGLQAARPLVIRRSGPRRALVHSNGTW